MVLLNLEVLTPPLVLKDDYHWSMAANEKIAEFRHLPSNPTFDNATFNPARKKNDRKKVHDIIMENLPKNDRKKVHDIIFDNLPSEFYFLFRRCYQNSGEPYFFAKVVKDKCEKITTRAGFERSIKNHSAGMSTEQIQTINLKDGALGFDLPIERFNLGAPEHQRFLRAHVVIADMVLNKKKHRELKDIYDDDLTDSKDRHKK